MRFSQKGDKGHRGYPKSEGGQAFVLHSRGEVLGEVDRGETPVAGPRKNERGSKQGPAILRTQPEKGVEVGIINYR